MVARRRRSAHTAAKRRLEVTASFFSGIKNKLDTLQTGKEEVDLIKITNKELRLTPNTVFFFPAPRHPTKDRDFSTEH